MLVTGGGERKQFEQPPFGTHMAICYKIVDLGHQHTNFGSKRQVMLTFELPNSQMSTGKPHVVSKTFTMSLSDKARLLPFAEALMGRKLTQHEKIMGFEMKQLLGKSCFINVSEVTGKDGNQYTEIGNAIAVPVGVNIPTKVNDFLYFSLDEFRQETFDKLSDRLKEKISQSYQHKDIVSGKVVAKRVVSPSREASPPPLDNSPIPREDDYGVKMEINDEIPF